MSSEDERLLARLGEALRDRQRREGTDAIEARLAAGHATEDQEVFAPIPERARAAMADRALEALAPPRRPQRIARRMFVAAALPLAAAAAWLLWPAPSLPVYELALAAGDDTARGAAGNVPPAEGVVTVSSGSRIDLVLRPARPVDGTVRAQLYLAGDPPIALELPAEVSASGAVRWSGTAQQLLGSRRGDLELRAVVGRSTSFPAAGPAQARGRGWQSFRIRLRVLNER
jgi:hypothetical protein